MTIGSSGNTLTITVIDANTQAPITSATVVLDASGTPTTVDAQGQATFANLDTNTHDIHVFADQYVWSSTLAVDPAASPAVTVALSPLTAPASEVILQAGLKNALIDASHITKAYFIVNGTTYTDTGYGVATGGTDGGGNPIYQWTFNLPFAASTSLTGTLRIIELTLASPTTNYTSDQAFMGSQTVTTVATGSNAPVSITGAPVTLSNPKPATATLATIQTVTPPAGMTTPSVSASVHPGSTGLGDAGLAGNATAQVAIYTGYDYTSGTQVFVGVTTVGTNTTWSAFQKYSVNSNVNQAAQIISLPVPNTGQVGATITWTVPGGTYNAQRLSIHDQGSGKEVWTISAPAGTSSVTLPATPTAVGTNVVSGTNYDLLMGVYDIPNLTVAQLLTTPGIALPGDLAVDAESFEATTIQTSWTR